ncbi:MAG: iron-containing alcohol dehydrogenase [Spirochaetales bacterium]|nr:iron-containing alcohol dehydrogenase [Spirochaetales bacterium]
MKDYRDEAYRLLNEWRGDSYAMGIGCLDKIGEMAASYGNRAMVVANRSSMSNVEKVVLPSLGAAGVELAGGAVCPGARPNAPKEDVYRIAEFARACRPDCIVAMGGGSTIDCCNAVSVLVSLGETEIDGYFGTGKVSKAVEEKGVGLLPVIAVQTSSSSGAHLTKYSNITDLSVGQKKLIVDPAIVPAKALFDYGVTCSMPKGVTIDGALDAVSHTFEVFCGAKGDAFDKVRDIIECALNLVIENARTAIDEPGNAAAREALGLAADLGGYAIMVGGTSGGHLTSFSLVDVVGHGTACGIMNPYYAVFYSKAIQRQLKVVGSIYARHGFLDGDLDGLEGRALAEAVAGAMISFAKSIGAPTKLSDLPAFSEKVHITRALSAAKDPDLKMKLQNMPVSMTADDVDEYMGPILTAAARGDLSLIKEM